MTRSELEPHSESGERVESGAQLATSWEALCDALASSQGLISGEGEVAEGYRYLARFLQAGIVSCVAHNDPDYPAFARMIDYSMPWGLDNPDCLYLYAPVRSGATYRIFGQRGSANHFDLQVNYGHYANGEIGTFGTIDSVDDATLECGADGALELTLGEGGPSANQLELGSNAEFVLVRQYFNDWENERPADLQIERSDAPLPIPSPTDEAVARQLALLRRWLEKGGALWQAMSAGFLSMAPNSILVHAADASAAHSGMRGQTYGLGNFACGPDDAVLITLRPPACRHWGVALANRYWECVEYGSRQSSLNGHQATLDREGVFRGVISQRDCGFANWLDPAHNERGTLSIRFLDADCVPEIELERVALADLERRLPVDAPRIEPGARAEQLVRRRRAVIARFRQ